MINMTRIICDSSSLISLSDNCLLCLLKAMNKEFIITPGVENEIINYPTHTKRFKLKAIQLKSLLDDGIIKVMNHPKLKQETDMVISKSNQLLEMNKKRIKIIQLGEAEAIALYKLVNADALLVDERTARHLIENPEKIMDYMQSKLNRKVNINQKILKEIQRDMRGINVIRSSELVAFAYEKGILTQCKMKNSLEAALYAVKFAGCSITEDEIQEYMKMM